MTVEKVQLLFSVRPDAIGVLESRLASEGQRVRGKLPPRSHHRRVIHLQDDPVSRIAHGDVGRGTPFEAIFEVSTEQGDFEDLTSALEQVPQRLEEWIDPEASAVVAGTEHTIVGGSEPFLLLYPLRRLSQLSRTEFQDYWLNKHTEVISEVPDVQGYRQFHTNTNATEAAAADLGIGMYDFDGVAEAYHSDIATFERIMSRPEVAEAALEDEKNFIDHERSVMIGLCRIAWDAPA